MIDDDVSVTSDTLPSDPGDTLDNLFKLCTKSTEIKSSVMYTLGKTKLGDVTVENLKKDSRITKTFLGESLLSIIGLIDVVQPHVNAPQTVFAQC